MAVQKQFMKVYQNAFEPKISVPYVLIQILLTLLHPPQGKRRKEIN